MGLHLLFWLPIVGFATVQSKPLDLLPIPGLPDIDLSHYSHLKGLFGLEGLLEILRQDFSKVNKASPLGSVLLDIKQVVLPLIPAGMKINGDMIIDAHESRTAISDNNLRWPQGKVPYVIDKSVDFMKDKILKAIKQYNDLTPVKFSPRTNEKNFARFTKGPGGCFTIVGFKNMGAQDINLGSGCEFVGTIAHEVGHCIGFWHEQQRQDRDDAIKIIPENVASGMISQFDKVPAKQIHNFNKFDTNSIMVYGNTAFSKNGKNTLEAKNGKAVTNPYSKPGLDDSDVERVKALYKQ